MAGGSVPTLFWFDRFDDRKGVLPVAGELVHTEELGGEDVIEFSTFETPTKGDRLLWLDGEEWREHVVVRTDEPLEGPCEVYAESSLCEMLCDFVEEEYASTATAEEALDTVLATTRWGVGEVDDLGEETCVFYHLTALAALRKIEDEWGCEIYPTIEVEDGRVSARSVNCVAERGEWRGLRLVHGKNIAGCTRTVLSDDVYTALYGFGAGLAVVDEDTGEYTGGYTRKLTFADVNDGQAWIGDDEARLSWGRWDAERGEKVHSFGSVTFSECEDASELLALTKLALADACEPKVVYEVDAAAVGAEDAQLGDTVAIVDSERDPEWRFIDRVSRRVRTFGDEVSVQLTIGQAEETDYEVESVITGAVDDLEEDICESEESTNEYLLAYLRSYIETYVQDSMGDDLGAYVDERVAAYLDEHLETLVQNFLDENLDALIQEKIDALDLSDDEF